MKKSKVLFGVLFSTLILAGGVTTAAVSKESKPVDAEATSSPNNMFGYIYNDSFNNQNNTLTLFVFEGTATGLADTTSFPEQRDLVKVNGVSCSSLAVWAGHNWFQVTYPTSSSYEGATLEFTSGIVAGDAVLAGCKFVMNSSLKWEFAGFNDSPTVTYQSIPYSDFSVSTQLLIQYTGGSGMPSDKVTNAMDIHNYDNYLTIDGAPLSSLSGAEIRSWNGSQRWLWLKFPAVSEGAVLKISKGMRFYSEVFEAMGFVFNSSGHWDYVDLIENDSLVKNSDYLLFTPSDLGLTQQNNDYPYYSNNLGHIFENSFGFQFNVTIPTSDVSTTTTVICFGSTDIFGSSPLFELNLNGKYKFYLSVNSSFEWNTINKSPVSWSGDTTHLVEFYFIKTDSSHAVFILGVDDLFVWKTPADDISSLDYTNHTWFSFKNTGTTKSKDVYSDAPTVEKALSRFDVNKLKSETIPFDDNRDTGACLTDYAAAKSFYENYLTDSQKTAFVSEDDYANLRARLSAWAAANGDSFSAIGVGSFSSIRNNLLFISDTDMSSTLLIIITSSAMAASIILFLIKKKKRQ